MKIFPMLPYLLLLAQSLLPNSLDHYPALFRWALRLKRFFLIPESEQITPSPGQGCIWGCKIWFMEGLTWPLPF